MLLSDASIAARLARTDAGRLRITPRDRDDLQPCSYDVHLGEELYVYTGVSIDTARLDDRRWLPLPLCEQDEQGTDLAWILRPGKLYLGVLLEEIELPDDLAGELKGVSTLARQGVVLHQQAGHIDPGYCGHPTLEITVVGAEKTLVRPGLRIGQLTFVTLDRSALHPYTGRYYGDALPQPARPPARLTEEPGTLSGKDDRHGDAGLESRA